MEPGEPEFLPADTDGAIALEEEERDTCPSCGLLKVWCRDPDHQFSFTVQAEQCQATYALSERRAAVSDKPNAAALQLSVRFADGKEPDLWAGLDLGEPGDDGDE